MKIPEKFDAFREFSSFSIGRQGVVTTSAGQSWIEGLVEGVTCNVTQVFGEKARIDEAGYREVPLETSVERVTCNLTQVFGEKARIDESGYREEPLETSVEVVACNVTQVFGEKARIGEAGYREVSLETSVEGVACNVTQENEQNTCRKSLLGVNGR